MSLLQTYRKTKTPYLLYAILPVALLMRLWWVFNVKTAPVYDFLKFHLGAVSIAEGMGYKLYGNPTAFEPIGYPGFLALLYRFLGPRIIFPKLANVAFSLGIIILTYLIGKKLFNQAIGLVAAFFIAFSPRNITYTSVLGNEIYFTFLMLVVIHLMLNYKEKKWSGPVIGIITGILALTKPFALLFPGALFFIDVVDRMDLAAAFKKAVVISLFTVLPAYLHR
jgi:4-amino-4-deoxy-L-arabinose transferase-like glycosyltransferase